MGSQVKVLMIVLCVSLLLLSNIGGGGDETLALHMSSNVDSVEVNGVGPEYVDAESIYKFLKRDPEEKFFFYSPSGGFNNQLKELEYAVKISQDLNRSLFIPLLARHTSWWTSYHQMKFYDTTKNKFNFIQFDRVLEIDELRKANPANNILLLNITIPKLEQLLRSIDLRTLDMRYFDDFLKIYRPKKRRSWFGTPVVQHAFNRFGEGDSKYKVLFLKGSSMYHKWYNDTTIKAVRKHVRYTKKLVSLAEKAAKLLSASSETNVFNAVHIRLGDYLYNYGRYIRPGRLIHILSQLKFDTSTPLYIATEPHRPDWYFSKFLTTYKHLHFSDSPTLANIRAEIVNITGGDGSLANDLMGVVEQLLCSLAHKFHGTSYSNFSRQIEYIRQHMRQHFEHS